MISRYGQKHHVFLICVRCSWYADCCERGLRVIHLGGHVHEIIIDNVASRPGAAKEMRMLYITRDDALVKFYLLGGVHPDEHTIIMRAIFNMFSGTSIIEEGDFGQALHTALKDQVSASTMAMIATLQGSIMGRRI